jgi:hypothetical protein
VGIERKKWVGGVCSVRNLFEMPLTFQLYVFLIEGPFGHFMSKFWLGAGWRQNLGQEAGQFRISGRIWGGGGRFSLAGDFWEEAILGFCYAK